LFLLVFFKKFSIHARTGRPDSASLLQTGAAIVAFIATPALAADLGPPVYKAPLPAPPPVPVATWTGCYVNAGAGYGMFDQNHQTIEDGVQETVNQTTGGQGWLGLVGVGCDYQFNNFLVGAMADYDFMDLHGNITSLITFSGQEKESSAWAVGGRVGYLVTPAILVYWNGGFTSTKFDAVNLTVITTGAGTPLSLGSQTFGGGFIGGRTEIAVQAWPGLYWCSEYRYSSYRSANVQFFSDGVPATGLYEHESKTCRRSPPRWSGSSIGSAIRPQFDARLTLAVQQGQKPRIKSWVFDARPHPAAKA
jgi:outer membrane immunogenic protein